MRTTRTIALLGALFGAAMASSAMPGLERPAAAATAADPALAAAIGGAWRTPKYVARDTARHPADELAFFGITPVMTVVEIWPGGGYWTEILAPYLKDHGTLYAAVSPPSTDPDDAKAEATFRAKLDANKANFGDVKTTHFGKGDDQIAPPGSADLVVTFRNLHNWMEEGWTDEALRAIYVALKPGGILGIEDHRARTDQPQDPKAKSGYVRQDYTIELAKKAGFELVGSSEINANPKDTKDWPAGVWTLPPTFALGDKDRAKYAAIGEADNYVLKFRKPLK
jgi:predicted methyltransferase